MAPRSFRNLGLGVVLCLLAVATWPCPGEAAARPAPPPPVAVDALASGFAVTTAAYTARIGGDGNLHSFRVGEAEMVDDRVGFSLGGFYYADGPLKLPQLTRPEPTTVEATDGVHALRYRFSATRAELTLTNRGTVAIAYFLVLSPDVTIVRNLRTGEAAAAPANARWPEASFSTRRGEYLILRGGDRASGPWLGRQVWEVSPIPANGEAQVVLEGGVGEQPKATLEQLVGVKATATAPEGELPRLTGLQVSAEVDNRADEALEALVSMELSACRTDLVLLSSAAVSLGQKQSAQATFQARVEAPDFYTARITVTAQGRQVAKSLAVAGYRVEEILPTPAPPPSFREFWQTLVTDARASQPDLQVTPEGARSTPEVRVAVASYPGLGGKTISGWYLTPMAPGKHPAILYLSGYGARATAPPLFLAQHGYVVLALDVRGNPVDRPRLKPFEDYCTVGVESPESYVYREIVGQALRGLWALARREEVDPDRMAAVGVSEGGGVGLMVAALEPRLRAVSADAPLLVDFPLSLRRAAWPYKRISQYVREQPERAAPVARTLSYFDLLNFAGDIKCPTLMSVGFLDQVSLPAAVYGFYNLLSGPKEIHPFPNAGHEGGGQEWWRHKLTWLDRQLAPPPQP